MANSDSDSSDSSSVFKSIRSTLIQAAIPQTERHVERLETYPRVITV